MSQKFYFFRTIQETATRNRLRPLPKQTLDNGENVFTNINVQASTEMRSSYPIGTVFGSEKLEIRVGGATPFYQTGDIYPVSIPEGNLKSLDHRPSDEMRSAWNIFSSANEDDINKNAQQQPGVFNTSSKPLSPLEKIQCNPKYAMPTVDKDGFWVDEDKWWSLMLDIIDNQPVFLKGPAATGKTELCILACKKLGIDYQIFDMGSMYDPISELLGVHRIGKNKESVFEYSSFAKAIQRKGVIILDEITRAAPTVANILLPVLDSRHELPVEMAGEHDARRIKVNPECRFIATGNTGAEYTGTFNQGELDVALKTRFRLDEINYMPVEEEVKMYVKRFGIGRADATNIVNTIDAIRSIYANGDISRSISTREGLQAAKKVQQGYTAKKAMEMVFLPGYEGSLSEGERSIIYQRILTR